MPTIVSIPLKELHTPDWNPRQFMDESKMQDLMAYLKNGGVVPRIWVWKGDGKPPREVISGQRRCVAYERLGRTEIEAEILDIPLEEAKILAITTNQDEEMHWWDWVRAIGRMAHEHDWNQRELAGHLGCGQATVNRAVQIFDALNPDAQALLDSIGINKNPTNTPHFELSERAVFALTSLAEVPPKGQEDDPAAKKRLEASRMKVAAALKMVIDREMTEAKAKHYVGWIKDGNDPVKYDPTRSTPSGRSGLKIDPNDPNGELWKVVPDWFRIKYQPKSEYGIATKGDKFGAPAAVCAYLSTMMEHFQRVQQVVNPQAVPANPFKDKVKELFEKGVQEALADAEREQKNWEKVQKGNDEKGKKQPADITVKSKSVKVEQSKPEMPSSEEVPAPEGLGGLPSEDDMKRLENGVKDVLGQVAKNPAEAMKKLLGGLFNKP